MFKKIFFHAIVASTLATIACIIYTRIYFVANEADFSKVINTPVLTGLNVLVCMLAALIYWGLISWRKKTGEVIFNFLFTIISFAGVIVPISITLPLNTKFPELFPGLSIPMIFFPALAWYTVKPLFTYSATNSSA
jgi:hypothetical protein